MTAPVSELRFKEVKKPIKLPQPKLLTYEDYVKLTPLDSGKYELHNGHIIKMPSPTVQHQDICGNIFADLKVFLRQKPIGKVYIAPLDTTFTKHDTFQPDVMFVRHDRITELEGQGKRLVGAPDFVVEVQSAGNPPKEMSYKRHIFETFGVVEYWLVNMKKQTVTQYENIEGEMVIRQTFKLGESVKSFIIEGFETTVDAIFQAN
jgi:Uma2 family endonuclease